MEGEDHPGRGTTWFGGAPRRSDALAMPGGRLREDAGLTGRGAAGRAAAEGARPGDPDQRHRSPRAGRRSGLRAGTQRPGLDAGSRASAGWGVGMWTSGSLLGRLTVSCAGERPRWPPALASHLPGPVRSCHQAVWLSLTSRPSLLGSKLCGS